ncbi:hypothetical protein CWC29_008335 [Pseudoalteromonas sp. S4498]|uniref:Transposase n=1 Tax=Pseudoalteromonas galatheae TaxID=579562 RepID=A0A8T6YNI8_9GAMM|nr:hypothetical protein [Pseudoalteromonas galatheae]
MQHLLPKGFMHIRHYGFLTSACRKRKLALIRSQASCTYRAKRPKTESVTLIPYWPCQHCKAGTLRLIGVFKLDATTAKVERTS